MGYFRNSGSGFVYGGNVWSISTLSMSQIQFLPGHWTGPTSGDLAYVTPSSNGSFDFSVLQSTGSGFNWVGDWWSPGNLAYATTKFVPADTNGDGLTDLLYVTPRGGGGFDMALDRNTGSNSFVWAGGQWSPTSLDINTTRFIPGYFPSSINEGFAYITPDGNGFDMGIMNMTSSGLEWKGLWWTAPNLPYNTEFVPADNNNDGIEDMFYVTPRGGGGFDMGLNHNTGFGFNYVGNQWSATNLSTSSTVFLPQF